MTELEAIELELINRELANRQQTPQNQELSSKMIPQFTKGLYESLPFGKRMVSMFPNAEQIQQQMETTPRPQGFLPSFARGAGAIAPDLAMSAPFMRGAKYIPKIPAIVRSALGFGAYGGTKASVQGEPILPSALSSGLSAALFHGAGRLGATAIPKFIPGAERLGSALGGGIAGQLTGGEEGMALGTGLGALYPATRIQSTEQSTKMAEGLVNYVLKPSKSLREFGKSPARAVVKEGLWGRNIADLDNKTQTRLNELNTYKDRLKFEAKNMGVTVNLAKNKVFQPLSDLLTELQKAPESNTTAINNITKNLNDLLAPQGKFRQLNNVSIDEAYNIRDIVNNLKPTGIFNTQSEAMTSKALHQVYHNIAEAINTSGISLDLKLTNKRMSDLITLKEAINDASNRNPSYWRMLPFPLMVGYALKGPLGVVSGLATLAAETTPGATTISKILGKKYPKIK